MIKRENGKYHLYSKDGSKHLGGPYDTEDEARERERQVIAAKEAKGALVELSLAITKATHDGHWQAVASDTLPDKTTESTSLSLFRDWIKRTESGASVNWLPPPRMPFLGVSHYPSLDGYGEAGVTEKMWIDGNRFKASGTFNLNNPVGKALFEAVKRERELVKRGEAIENPIRISAAWWDISHSHGPHIFERKSLSDICPMCLHGAGNKVYLSGQVDHWAGTRVPINPRTSLEEKSMAITRKDDAASIIDEDLAEELDQKARLTGKSETETEPVLVIKANKFNKESEDKEEDEKQEGERYAEEEEDKKQQRKALTEKTNPMMAHANGEEGGYYPLGGALSLDAADNYIKQGKLVDQAYTNYDIYQMVFQNIMQYAPETQKMELLQQATADFNERIATIKAAVVDAWLIDSVEGDAVISEKGDTTMPDIFDSTRDAVNAALQGAHSRQETIEAIQKAFTSLAGQVEVQVNTKYPQSQAQVIAEAVKAAVQPLYEEIGLLKAKAGQPVQVVVPQQKSVAGNLSLPTPQVQNNDLPVSPVTGQPSSLTQMIRRSVGIAS